MSDKIEEIRRKLPDVGFYTETGVDYQHLLAEVDRLRAENERLTRERDESRAEVARLCDDIEHLLSLSLRP